MHRHEVKRLTAPSLTNSQDGFPIRIKAVNIINEPRIFKGIFAIIKPFLKEKMAERVSVLSSSSQRCCEDFSQTWTSQMMMLLK